MSLSNFRGVGLIVLLQIFIFGCHSQNYHDLEGLGINCPSRDRCLGYINNLTYMERSCECDLNCTAYQDCCIDALSTGDLIPQIQRPPARADVTCLHYGEDDHTGVYVISNCSSGWNGPREVREKCGGSDDFSDPLSAVPVTDVAQKDTYRNLACAECNNANLASLKTFRLKIKCHGVQGIAEEQIMADLTYNQEHQSWGINRLNSFGNETEFFGCDITFDVPGYLKKSVRFCRPNLISECVNNWNHTAIAKLCAQYMAVVYSNAHSYRNPHCAVCNHKTVAEVSCRNEQLGRRKRGLRFPIILDQTFLFVDVNPSDGGIYVGKRPVATPACPSGQVYDVFFKKCRQLVCALPGRFVVNGRCVKI